MDPQQMSSLPYKLNLLLVEDQQDDELLLLREFRNARYELNHLRVQTAEEFRKALKEHTWDLVISDFQMPQFSGLEALQIVRSKYPDLPFIISSGAIGEEVAVEIIRRGADDYLMKDKLERLIPVVERALREGETRKQRRIAEKQLEAMRQRLEGVIQSAMDAIITVDEEHKIIAFNAAAEEMFGYQVHEILGTPLSRLMPQQFSITPGEHIRTYSQLKKHTNQSIASSSPLLGLKKDGQQFPIEASISQIQVNGNKFFTAIIRDVTERTMALQALAEEKQRLELALKGGKQGLWDWLLDTNEMKVDERWPRVLGYTLEEMPVQMDEWAKLVHPEDRLKLKAIIDDFSAKSIQQMQFEFRILSKRGDWRWLLSTGATTEWDAAGKPLRVLGTYLDITEKKTSAEQIRKMELAMLNIKLQEQRSKSSEFLRGQEQERQRLARELHDGIGQLLNVHKIQLSMGVAPSEALASVDQIIKEVVRINNNLMPLVLQDFGLESGVRQLTEMYAKVTPAEIYYFSDLQGIRFNADVEAGAYRIVQEATSNAVKYAQATQISIQLTQQDNVLLIMIEDDGVGFAPEEIMKNHKKGFGLVNMRYRVEALEGQIEIDSKTGQGCLINVVLPIRS